MSIKLTILGAGPGGYVAAIRAASFGMDVTLIEKENLGGTCLNYGCIPSKIMKHSANLFDKARNAAQFGVNINDDINFDMNTLMERKQKVVNDQRKGIETILKKNGVTLIFGKGFIEKQGLIKAELTDGSVQKVHFDRLIIATGTKPLELQTFPFDHHKILSSNDILQLKYIPDSMTIVGGGVIGCEFAFILSSLGTEVTIVEAMPRLLPVPSIDENCSKILQREMKKKKIKIHLDRIVEKVQAANDKVLVTINKSPFYQGKKEIISIEHETDTMAVCIGRVPITNEIGLENIGIKIDNNGWINVNEYFETNVEGVYAIGDILGPEKIMLAHVASHEGMTAVDNILGKRNTMDYSAIPGSIFTSPEIANVGISETQAVDQGFDINTFSVNFRSLGKAQAIGEIAGEAKIIVDNKTGRILGIHLVGPHATDLIAEGTLAIKNNLTVSQMADTVHAHPTLAEIMAEVALKAEGTPLHG